VKIKFITLTCEKYHDSRVSKIRQTWGNAQDVTFLSDLNIGDDIIGYEHLPKGYENIHYKYSEFFRTNSDLSYDWYFFTDDDTYVNIKNINDLLKNYKPTESICIGVYGELHPDATDKHGNHTGFPLYTIKGEGTNLPLTYPSGGAGFILSVESMKRINQYLNTISDSPRCYNSDVTIGFWIRNAGIVGVNVDGFWWTNPDELKHSNENIKNSYTYHYVNEKMMEDLYNL
jgi:hypothetical protein